jgi:hypothetical protein
MQKQSLKLQISLLVSVLLTAIDATSIVFAVPVGDMYHALRSVY